MERLTQHLVHELAAEFRVVLCGPEGAAAFAPRTADVVEIPPRPLARFLVRAQWSALRLARDARPNLVIAASGLTAPAAWLAARVAGAPWVTFVHGLDLVVPNAIYRRGFLPAMRGATRVVANSANTARLAQRAGIAAARTVILHPGVDMAPDRPADATAFRQRIGAGQRRILLNVGRLTPRKGLAEFVVGSLKEIVAVHPDVLLVVIGGEATDAAGGSRGPVAPRLMQLAREAGVADHLVLLGAVEDDVLRDAYAGADVHVFPVRDLPGDVEGFGMVAVEAAAHGLPTVAFAAGGVADAVADGVSGRVVTPGDYAGMAIAVLRQLEAPDRAAVAAGCRAFAESFSWEIYGRRLRALCRDLCEEASAT
ncbi:MAG: glycosyltransferase family 4 protein [Betaproteobacteria bacterium]|nr:glycosyltransferase family 4 protein [Betaproteobacteria bacterium]